MRSPGDDDVSVPPTGPHKLLKRGDHEPGVLIQYTCTMKGWNKYSIMVIIAAFLSPTHRSHPAASRQCPA